MSICLSDTTQYTDSSPGEIETPGFFYRMLVHSLYVTKFRAPGWKDSPRKKTSKRGPPKNSYFTTISSSSVRTLQIDTNLLLIITNTADELSEGTNTNDLERPRTPEIGSFSDFFALLGCDTHFKSELRRNHWRWIRTTCGQNFQH